MMLEAFTKLFCDFNEAQDTLRVSDAGVIYIPLMILKLKAREAIISI